MADSLEASPQVEADKRLIQFNTYDDYLNSLVTVADHCYLQSPSIARVIAELGYRSSGETLTRDEFDKRLAAVRAYLYPKFIPYTLANEGIKTKDPFLQELALRERPNRLGVLSTIIFLRHFTNGGFEVSGYIDYCARLLDEDWRPIFKGQKRIWPKTTDLGFYDWRTERTACNHSRNFKVRLLPKKGLVFQNRYDRKLVFVDPAISPGSNSRRLRVLTPCYENVILYDHVVMQRI